MTRPLSDDLRRRVVAAVDDEMSRRGAAKRFGIAPLTAQTPAPACQAKLSGTSRT